MEEAVARAAARPRPALPCPSLRLISAAGGQCLGKDSADVRVRRLPGRNGRIRSASARRSMIARWWSIVRARSWRRSFGRQPLEPVQLLERVARRQAVGFDLGQLVGKLIASRCQVAGAANRGKSSIPAAIRRSRRARPRACEHRLGARYYVRGRPASWPRNAVAAVGAPSATSCKSTDRPYIRALGRGCAAT